MALAVDLGSWDVENDEAIYTYAAERMIDTGDWLTPRDHPARRAVPREAAAEVLAGGGPIELGLLPRSPFGLRAIDALLGAIAFGYVALFGYRLSGVACAIASCLILFGLRDLLLVHGLRTNNMEASLVAAYAGGLYHFAPLAADGRRRDALAVGAWFTLAFLTKFVAAAFLPMVALAASRCHGRRRCRSRWRACLADWGWAAALSLLVSAPWFVYEYSPSGDELDRDDVPAARLRALHRRARSEAPPALGLLPAPHCAAAGRRALRVAGGGGRGRCCCIGRAVRRDGAGLDVLVWGVLPLALISALTSKLLHYAYPFLPPFAIAGGVALAAPLDLLKEPLERLAGRLERARLFGLPALLARPASAAIALGHRRPRASSSPALALAVRAPPRSWSRGLVLRNSSVMRPLMVAIICFALTRAWRHVLTIAPVALMALLPLGAARETLICGGRARASAAHAPRLRPTAGRRRPHSRRRLRPRRPMVPHTYAFYFLPLGGWQPGRRARPRAGPAAILDDPVRQRADRADRPRASAISACAAARRAGRAAGGQPPPGWVVLLPGPLGACVDPTRSAPAGTRSAARSRAGRDAAVDLSIVIPAYNEAGRIGPTLDRLIATLDPLPLPWEILVADDGSIDDTAAIVGGGGRHASRASASCASRTAARARPCATASSPRTARGASCATPICRCRRPRSRGSSRCVPSQCDIAIGSREGEGAVRIGEPLHRHLLGRVFNTLVRAMVLPGIQDTQCGFKMFTAAAAEAVLPTTAIEGWSFDVELLASARAQGWRIREVPIEWHFGQASKLRVLPHSLEMLRDL